ncbi:hypothetical protein N0V94_009119 [Neodidymelliopsis sp. IMI 364377]|nr:hypothetical protein N0V94_009119 [Neodidymelliopsis sp. IMI 364377]
MAPRTAILTIPPGMASNPYNRPKEQIPRITLCELCDKSLNTKDWNAHKNSKKHRAAEAGELAKDKTKVDSNGFDGFSGDATGFNPQAGFEVTDTGATNDGWGASDTNGWGSTGGLNDGFGSSNYGNKTGGGGGDRACFGCGETGHTKRECPKGGSGGGGQACFNCGIEGHRKMDCPEPPKPRGGGNGGGDRLCFNCDLPGHNKSECTAPPKPRTGGGAGGGRGRACFNCLRPGHNVSECPEERVTRCRNCDAVGHESRECDKPRDWSRVKCSNCYQYGHGAKRCPVPAGAAGAADDSVGGGWDNSNDSGGGASAAAVGSWTVDDAGAGAQDSSGNWADEVNANALPAQW